MISNLFLKALLRANRGCGWRHHLYHNTLIRSSVAWLSYLATNSKKQASLRGEHRVLSIGIELQQLGCCLLRQQLGCLNCAYSSAYIEASSPSEVSGTQQG